MGLTVCPKLSPSSNSVPIPGVCAEILLNDFTVASLFKNRIFNEPD